jgi:hypothetical protein
VIEKYHEPILEVLTTRGALGVNQISQATGIPLSTVHKYLTSQQKYFRKTQDRKWDLPERVTAEIQDDALKVALESLDGSIVLFRKQLEEVQATAENLAVPIRYIQRAAEVRFTKAPFTAPKAVASPEVHPVLEEVRERAELIAKYIKENIKKIPEEHRQLFLNFDIHSWIAHKGLDYAANSEVTKQLSLLLMGQAITYDKALFAEVREYQRVVERTHGVFGPLF